MKKPQPHQLYYQAHGEHPGNEKAGDARYLALMEEHGYVMPRCQQIHGGHGLRCSRADGHPGDHKYGGR